MRRIPLIHLATERRRELFPGILAEIGAVAERSDFILGRQVAEFEENFRAREGGAHSISVHSGLDALWLTLAALGVGPGDEVVTSPFSFVATGAAVALTGARPVFADIDWSGNLDPSQIEAVVTPRTKAILPVGWAGIPGPLGEWKNVAVKHGLALVHDSAQCVGSRFAGSSLASNVDAACYSLHPLKNLGLWGDGGIVLTSEESIADKLRLSRNHGLVGRGVSAEYSQNSRLDTIQAVVGLAYLELLDEVLEARRRNARFYLERFRDLPVRLPLAGTELEQIGIHLFQIVTDRREELSAYLDSRGIEAAVHYPMLIPFQPAAGGMHRPGEFPVAEEFARGVLTLPVREDLTLEEGAHVADAVEEFFS